MLHHLQYLHCLLVLVCAIQEPTTGKSKMETLKELKDYGMSLGYEGEELKLFVRDQQAIAREERQHEREYKLALEQAQRQKESEEHEYQLALEKASIEKETVLEQAR